MNIDYQIFDPRVDRPLHELTSLEAKEAYDWFIENIEERLVQLANILETSKSGVVLDFSENSLEGVHDFFHGFSSNDFKNKNQVPSSDLLSLCNDIGIYISEMLIRKHNNLSWKLNVIKGNVSYQRPVISGFSVKNKNYNYDFDRILIAYAYRLIKDGMKEESFFRRLYLKADELA